MSISVHILTFNEEDILPYTLRHYATFADKIIIHDGGSTDRTREIAQQYEVEIREWRTDGLNDKLAKELKEQAWRTDGTDWAIMVDADELIYFPMGAWNTLASYDSAGVAMVRPQGFEMVSEVFPTTDGQIYDEVVIGCPENEWYAKPVLFSANRISSVEFSAGAHEAWATTKQGYRFHSKSLPTLTPPTYFLHFHHLGPVERIAERYARQRARLSALNVAMKWGNFDPPMKHATDKRQMIMAGVTTVIS